MIPHTRLLDPNHLQRATRGLVVGAAWIAGLLVAEPLMGGFGIVAVAEEIIFRSPGWLSSTAIGLLGFYAQPALVVGLILAVLVTTSVVAVAWPQNETVLTPVAILSGIVVTTWLFLATGTGTGISFRLVPGLLLAVVPPYLVAKHLTGTTDPANRRPFLRRVGAVAVAGTASVVGLRWLFDRTVATEPPEGSEEPLARSVTPPSGESRFDIDGIPTAVTAPEDHYVVDINITKPEIETESWTLDVYGAVEQPYGLGYDELLEHRRQVDQVTTMVCISNRVGGELIGTAQWTGVQLSDLIHTAVPTDRAVDVVTHAADGYSEAIPIDLVEREDILIAYGMGGRTLAVEHGFPARLLIPGRYGMKMTKWITAIEVVEEEHEAYWEARGWDQEAVINTMSYIRGAERDGDQVVIGGVAFGGLETGSQEISGVDVSVDGGDTWHEAELESPLDIHAWRRWRYEFEAPDQRQFSVECRAIERDGTVQTEDRTDTVPSGATGWHWETVEI